MGRIIAVANQKGGVGKTTTAINLSSCLASLGKKVLAIDMDPQGNMTSGLGIDKNEVEYTVYELILGQVGIEKVICKDALENLDVLPTNINLSAAEIELIGVEEKEFIIRKEVDKVKNNYDFIVIDCPPVMLVSDAIPIGNVVDGTIFVCSSQLTGRKDAKASIEILQKNNVNILGTVLSKVEVEKDKYNNYYYY